MFDAYAVMTKLKDKDKEEQVATLVTCLGIGALDLYEALPFRDEEERKDVQVALQYLEQHFAGSTNVILERFCFNTRSQGEGESISQYITELRQQARKCAFDQSR